MTNFFKTTVFLFLTSALVSSCSKTGSNENAAYIKEAGSGKTVNSDSSFATLKSEVLSPHCIRCHSNFESESGLSSSIRTNDPLNSPLLTYVQSGQMPPNSAKLSDEKITLIKNYLNAINSRSSAPPAEPPVPQPEPQPSPSESAPPATPSVVRFARIKQELLNPSCIKCHRVGGRLDQFEFYENVKRNAQQIEYEISAGRMPPPRFQGPRPTSATLDLFRTWIRQGMPE